jgi:hypothetical protein
MHKRVTLIGIIAILLIGTGAIRMRVPLVFAQDPTIPTRTPTPDSNAPPPPQPTNPPAPTASGNEGSPAATNTPEPGQIVNPLPPAGQVTQTPDTSIPGGATAAPQSGSSSGIRQEESSIGINPCDETPYIQALSRITVHAGPGLNYPAISTLERDELRPITGRAGFATWWQIQVRPNLLGWVLDEEVAEFGNTASVPIVEPPMLNGITPTPGVAWDPTPLPFVPCLPTETPTPDPDGVTTTGSDEAGGGTVQETESGATETAESAGMVNGNEALPVPGESDSSLAGGVGVAERGLAASRNDTARNNSLNLILPLVGIGLIGAGILLALLARNRSSTPPADAQPKES